MRIRTHTTHILYIYIYIFIYIYRHDKTLESLEGEVKALLAEKEAVFQELERVRVRGKRGNEGGREGGRLINVLCFT